MDRKNEKLDLKWDNFDDKDLARVNLGCLKIHKNVISIKKRPYLRILDDLCSQEYYTHLKKRVSNNNDCKIKLIKLLKGRL